MNNPVDPVFPELGTGRNISTKRLKTTGVCRKIHVEEFYNFYSSLNIIRTTKSGRMILAGYVASIVVKRKGVPDVIQLYHNNFGLSLLIRFGNKTVIYKMEHLGGQPLIPTSLGGRGDLTIM